ncbi:MAG: polysaccharide pyruvyl transferase family protein [Planctomycetaceae bacterium]|jgi:hypothetical protein|nr:polysaccharide pyruvyl transferase family protein [Planctomycetaceae bacterium]
MKIGIVTFHDEKNYGAVLQTFALQEVLRSIGYQPCIVGFHPHIVTKQWHPVPLSKINNFTKLAKAVSERIIFRRSVARCRSEFWRFFREHYSQTEPLYESYEALTTSPPDCDAFIVGSDQVWNPKCCHPRYFLEFAGAGAKRISYAASGISALPEKWTETYRNALAKFSHISCREPQGCSVVNKLLGTGKAELVLDPTLLYTTSDWEQLLSSSPPDIDLPDSPYILVYDHSNKSVTTDIAEYLKRKSPKGTELVLTGPFDKKYWDRRFDRKYCVGPVNFLHLIRKAKLVVTVSFHGTILSYLLRTPFLTVLPSAVQDVRISHLLDTLRLPQRRISGIDDLPADWASVDFGLGSQHLHVKREESLQFLRGIAT